MAVLTIRDVSEETLELLRHEADVAGRSLTRHALAVLDQQAERCRKREQLNVLATRLEAARARLGVPSVDSAQLLWLERGSR
jgi:hypothetical protein